VLHFSKAPQIIAEPNPANAADPSEAAPAMRGLIFNMDGFGIHKYFSYRAAATAVAEAAAAAKDQEVLDTVVRTASEAVKQADQPTAASADALTQRLLSIRTKLLASCWKHAYLQRYWHCFGFAPHAVANRSRSSALLAWPWMPWRSRLSIQSAH